jgi:hypothetical protein
MAAQKQHWPCEDKSCEFDGKVCCTDEKRYVIIGTTISCCRYHPQAGYVPPKDMRRDVNCGYGIGGRYAE